MWRKFFVIQNFGFRLIIDFSWVIWVFLCFSYENLLNLIKCLRFDSLVGVFVCFYWLCSPKTCIAINWAFVCAYLWSKYWFSIEGCDNIKKHCQHWYVKQSKREEEEWEKSLNEHVSLCSWVCFDIWLKILYCVYDMRVIKIACEYLSLSVEYNLILVPLESKTVVIRDISNRFNVLNMYLLYIIRNWIPVHILWPYKLKWFNSFASVFIVL